MQQDVGITVMKSREARRDDSIKHFNYHRTAAAEVRSSLASSVLPLMYGQVLHLQSPTQASIEAPGQSIKLTLLLGSIAQI